MKKRMRLMPIISLFLAIGTLTGCSSVQLPRLKGKAVTFTNTELTRKFERLGVSDLDGKIIETTTEATYKEADSEDSYDWKTAIKATRNFENLDLWYNQTYEKKLNQGKVKTTLAAFESKRYTYFDVKQSNNLQFADDDDNYEIFDGKYLIEKDTGFLGNSNTVASLASYLGIGYLEMHFTIVFMYTDFDLMLDLNSYNYSKLKFFESNEYFSISLKADLKSLKKERADIYDIFEEYMAFPTEDELVDFRYEVALVFERNKLIATGIDFKYETKEEGVRDTYYNLMQLKSTTQFVDKTPKQFKTDNCREIKNLSELIK